MRTWRLALATLGLSVVAVLAGCGGGGSAASVASGGSAAPSLSALAAVGEQIFHDPSLSKHHNQACASCHVAEVGHAGPLSSGAVETGSDGHSLGSRVAPSLRYLAYNRAFRFDAGTPTGGFFWDGRAATLAEQAKGPLLNPAEMANDSVDAVISQLAQTSYAPAFKALFGDDIFTRPTAAFEGVARALQAYQQEGADFAPFSSKYDAFLRGQAQLSAQELRGLLAFNSSSKGNCAACHPSGMGATGGLPLFTDFSYDVLGVPRNPALPGTWGDKGLCVSAALDGLGLTTQAQEALCGAFKVPSLRNVGLRKAYFHNGRFTTLTEVVSFYVQRDTQPDKWYPTDAQGNVIKFDDLPQYAANVNVSEAPYNRQLGDAPALTDSEIADVVAFLCTLTDGWSASVTPRCNRGVAPI